MKKFIGCQKLFELEDLVNGLKMLEIGISQETGIGLLLCLSGEMKNEKTL